MSSTNSIASQAGLQRGRRLAERLGLKIIGTEGHDLRCACVSCSSSDAGRVHEDKGVYFCYSCQKALNAWDLCKVLLGHEEAKRVMIEVGLFEDFGAVGSNGHTSPSSSDTAKSDRDLIDEIAQAKGTTGDGFRAYGAVVKNGAVIIPTFRLSKEKIEKISHFTIRNTTDKGLNAEGRPAGCFLPVRVSEDGRKGRVVGPSADRLCILCEGGKNPAKYHELGFYAVGLPGKHVKKEFLPDFLETFRGVNVALMPDGDLQSFKAFKELGAALHGIARSVRLAHLPYGGELKETGGDDVRDVLRRLGADGPKVVRDAIAAAKPLGKDGEEEIEIPGPCSLRELIASHPTMRPPVIDGLLRVGETANFIADPKRGKSWAMYGLAASVAEGLDWLDTYRCTRGRVLILDAELHPEVIASRLQAVADAMGLSSSVFDAIDVLPLRGLGIDMKRLRKAIESIEPGRYALTILDAWYRFLPPGCSENDNGQVMELYNCIDSYTAHLQSAWVNVHHASKGDQSGKGVTDVGSGAGSQSRAADTHIILRRHEQDDVAVMEAVVRSWPPVERLALRWSFPVWQRDMEADPRKLWVARQSRDKNSKEAKDIHLDEDRQGIVNAMVHGPGLQTKTEIRDSARIGNPRFGYAWASLIADKTIIPAEKVAKGNNRRYEAFALSRQETDQ